MSVSIRLDPVKINISLACEWIDANIGSDCYNITCLWPLGHCEFCFVNPLDASSFALQWA